MRTGNQTDLTRTLFQILIIGGLIAGSTWTLLPFLSSMLWATTIVVATWPAMLALERRFGGRRIPAVGAMLVTIVAIFILPFGLAVGVLLQAAIEGVEQVRSLALQGLPEPPAWLQSVPLLGRNLSARWAELAAAGPDAVTEALRPFLRSTASWAIRMTGGFGVVAVHFVLTVVIAAILYANGETAARGALLFARRLGAERSEQALRLAGQALRGVALGVGVTALVQALLAGLGLWLVGVPHAGLLLAVVFVLCIAQIGPLPVLLPAIIWAFWTGEIAWGAVLTALSVLAVVADNILKPLLIRRGVELPLVLIISGVIGGLLGFGVVGLFIGPVLLAVAYTLLEAWVRDEDVVAH